ncbi:MAG: response regulator [Candidatus Eisenbacteria bacterium]
MTLFEHRSWTRPQEPASARNKPAAGSRQAVRLLHPQAFDAGVDSRRVRLGLAALALISAVVLNIGIYQSGRNDLVNARWDELARATDARRDQLQTFAGNLHHEARYVAEQPVIAVLASRALDGDLRGAGADQLRAQLAYASSVLALHGLVLLGPRGDVLAGSAVGAPLDPAVTAPLARRLASAPEHVVADIAGDGASGRLLVVAVPAPVGRGRNAVLVAAANADDVLPAVFELNPVSGLMARLYVVREDDHTVRYLTSPDPAFAEGRSFRMKETAPMARPGLMAAMGAESNLETLDLQGRPVFATTRHLPELGWGIVTQIDHDALMADMRGIVDRLLLLDGALVIAAVLAAWLWRRNFESGLASHERRVTVKHAERVQAIFDTAFDAIITFDREGVVRTANRAAETMFRRGADDLVSQPLGRLLRWAPATGATAGGLPAVGVVCVGEAMRADGEIFPAEFSCGQAGEDDDLVYTAIVRDITDRVESERRIRAFAEGLEHSNQRLEEMNAQLEEASRLKSEFLANTSHELRTPLNGMIGFLQLVLDGMCENEDEERDFIKQALQCSRHLLGLINDVLDIAKIEAGKLSLDLERVEVQTLFQEVQTLTHVQAAQKGLQLRFEPPAEPVALRCDFAKTKQVLINLVGNSLKFTSKGSITVRAHVQKELGYVLFDVTDTGIGIPRDKQKVVFEKFQQGDGSTTRKYGGTGLGLSISRSLVELQGGIIGVHSDGPGSGTRMYFSIPTWRVESEPPTVVDEHVSERITGPAAGALVLVVEDDVSFRRFVTTVLHQSGYRTVEANHAEAGWALVRRLRPALVVVDYALSCGEGAAIRTGWDLAVRMTLESSTRHVPVVFVTGFDDEVREKLRSTAFARQPAHLLKPIEPTALIEQVNRLASGVSGRQVRVLMADDDPTVAAFARKVLPEPRFLIEHAADGQECLHLLRTRADGFDLLLLDLMMPNVSGYDVLREMTLTGTASELPVLVLTNFPEARDAEERRLLEQGLVLDVLAKTAVHDNPQLLAHVIEWHLQVTRDDGSEREAA